MDPAYGAVVGSVEADDGVFAFGGGGIFRGRARHSWERFLLGGFRGCRGGFDLSDCSDDSACEEEEHDGGCFAVRAGRAAGCAGYHGSTDWRVGVANLLARGA